MKAMWTALAAILICGVAEAAETKPAPKTAPAKTAPAKPGRPPASTGDANQPRLTGLQSAKRQEIEVKEGQTVSLSLPRRGWLYVSPPTGGRIFVDEAKSDPSVRVIYAGGEGLIFQHYGSAEGKARVKARMPDGRTFKISVSIKQGQNEYLYAVLK